MSAVLLRGKEISPAIREQLESEITQLSQVTLATLRIGDSEDALFYQKSISKSAAKLGINHAVIEIGSESTMASATDTLDTLVRRDDITGILLLSPMPNQIHYETLLCRIPHSKDAEGTRYHDQEGEFQTFPPTAMAIMETLLASRQDLKGKNAVVVGRSRIVGKPVAELLLQRHATVTLCHSRTTNLQHHISHADIVVGAVGKPGLIQGAWIKKGALVSDAGEAVVDGKPCGDVEFDAACEKAAFITPVPGGVGPLTSLMLFKNLILLAKNQAKLKKQV